MKKICLVLIIVGLLGFYTQPTQAGFFDWFSWPKIKSFFIVERVGEQLPASVSEPIEEILPSEEEFREIPEEILPKITSETSQELTIQNLKNQIASFKNQIKSLKKQIEDLLAKSPEIKEIVKEIPVEKIVYIDRLVVQECEECPICSEVESESELSEYFLTMERIDLSPDFLSTIYLSQQDNLIMFTTSKLCAWEYVPTHFDFKSFTVELTGTANNDDFLNASWRGKYFYKVGDTTLVWNHPFEIGPANFDCADFNIEITGIKNPNVSFQFKITEDSFEIVEGSSWLTDGYLVGVDGDFPIHSWRVEVEE